MTLSRLARALALSPLLFAALPASAHTTSDSYLTLSREGGDVDARWDLSLKDLDFALGLDKDDDGAITWRELAAAEAKIARYALTHLEVREDGVACTVVPHDQKVARHHEDTYAALALTFDCAGLALGELELRYSAFFEHNPGHRGLLVVEGGAPETAVLRPDRERVTVSFSGDAAASPPVLSSFVTFVVEGVWHIWIGLDHILFLLALLLPSVLRREGRGWSAREGLRPVLLDVLRVVTAFTVAHSITLCLAATGISRLPSSFVETGIALSVALVALNNVLPVFKDDRWTVTFALGLLHGFGFSSVLMDLDLPKDGRLVALFGFNVGVEVGQLVIVAAFLPLAYALRRTLLYQRLLLAGGSLFIALVALMWTIERAFSLSFPSLGGLPW